MYLRSRPTPHRLPVLFFKKRTPLRRLSDEELLAQYRESQERELVGELFGRHAELIFLVCMKYLKDSEEAKDASMGVFEKLLSDLHRYEVRNFKFWLHTVSKNHCLALLEKRRRLPTESLQRPEQVHSLVESEQETALWKELEKRPGALEHLDAAIGALNPEQRDCIRLFYL